MSTQGNALAFSRASTGIKVGKSNARSQEQKFFSKGEHNRQSLSCCAIIQAESRKSVHPMKMGRLIGILSILLQREKVTAPQLEEQFVGHWH